ncbi:MAG: hypothetical protein ACLVAO_10265 [Clostridium fessum]
MILQTRDILSSLSGLTEEGKVLINDPNSKINSRKKWDLNTIINQMNAAWSFWV